MKLTKILLILVTSLVVLFVGYRLLGGNHKHAKFQNIQAGAILPSTTISYDLTKWTIKIAECSPTRCIVGLTKEKTNTAVIVYDKQTKKVLLVSVYQAKTTEVEPNLKPFTLVETRISVNQSYLLFFRNNVTGESLTLEYDKDYNFVRALVFELVNDAKITAVPTYDALHLDDARTR